MVAMILSQRSRLNIVVLAAGFSSRLGQSKPLARLHGTRLLRRTLEVLVQVTSRRITVVVPPRAALLRAVLRGRQVTVLNNFARAGGLSTSVVLALRKAPYSGATLFLPADLPQLTPRDVWRLVTRWQGQRRRVVARGVAGRATTPLILPNCLYARARELRGDVGLRDLILTLPADDRILLDLPSAAIDVDTPQDLAAARRHFGAASRWRRPIPKDRTSSR